MIDPCAIPHPLHREGAYQWERLQEGLKEGFYLPDDRSLEDMVVQVASLAKEIRYYDETLNEWGRWDTFFDYLYDYQFKKLRIENIDALLAAGNVPPHLALMLGFLKTFEITRAHFNTFTGRHLDFYYQDVLQLAKLPNRPDQVVILAEPEKNSSQALLPIGTALNAGKDALNMPLVYTTDRDLIVRHVSIAAIKSVYTNKLANNQISNIHVATDPATSNKLIDSSVPAWLPFGGTANAAAGLGFGISSPILFASEGRRRISLEINTNATIPRSTLEAWYTGPEGWVAAEVDLQPGGLNNATALAKKFLLVKVDESLPAIAAYDEKIHNSGYSTTSPVLKIMIRAGVNFAAGYAFLASLNSAALQKIVVNVEGSKSFSIYGENGKLNPLQAFKPFGATPTKNKSFFTIGSSQAFNKYLKTFHLAINWKGAPGNFNNYYSSYNSYLTSVSDLSVSAEQRASFKSQWASFDQGNVPGKVELLSGGKWKLVKEDTPNYYKVKSASHYNNYHVANVIQDAYSKLESDAYVSASKWGFAKVTLKYDFGHLLYPKVLTHTVTENAVNKAGLPIPPAPYTPEFNSLNLDYVLEDDLSPSSSGEHKLLQIHPFGHQWLSSASQTLIAENYEHQGQLYIGLSGCEVPQIINLYIARIDGTEDKEASIDGAVTIAYLAAEVWKEFSFEQTVLNTTLGFTSSGFISVAIPEDALLPNTIMGEDLCWIRISSSSSAAAYPAIAAVHTNAVSATFLDRANDPMHLLAPLPAATITKMVTPVAGIKKVTQPYASFGGKPAESSDQFYTRVSERLRHKNRAVSIWDYERLVLENFPAIYKVKCISHATENGMRTAGNILCIVLPATKNVQEKDVLQPRVSRALLTEITNQLLLCTSPFVAVQVTNPTYEPITVSCTVKIRAGYDEHYSATLLNEAIKQYISPWLTDSGITPSFGGKIYASGIINFIEEQEYVDYITAFSATKQEQQNLVTWKEFTQGSSEAAILTSAEQHLIDTNAVC